MPTVLKAELVGVSDTGKTRKVSEYSLGVADGVVSWSLETLA